MPSKFEPDHDPVSLSCGMLTLLVVGLAGLFVLFVIGWRILRG